jgi:hypothetical protein
MTTSDSVLQLPFPREDIFGIAPQARELLQTRPITRARTLVGDEAWLVSATPNGRRRPSQISRTT